MRLGIISIVLASLLLAVNNAAADVRCKQLASMQEAQELAEQAASHLREAGPEQAFSDFVNPAGKFMRKDLYVFVFRRDGLLILNAGFPEVVGSNLLGGGDGQGAPFARDAMRLTQNDGAGWIAYNWYNPCTGSVMAKRSYVVGVGHLIVGVGAYGSMEMAATEDPQKAPSRLRQRA